MIFLPNQSSLDLKILEGVLEILMRITRWVNESLNQTGKLGKTLSLVFFFFVSYKCFHLHFPCYWSKTAKEIYTKWHSVWVLFFTVFTRHRGWNDGNPGFPSHTLLTKLCLFASFLLCSPQHKVCRDCDSTLCLWKTAFTRAPDWIIHYLNFLAFFYRQPNNLKAGEQTF